MWHHRLDDSCPRCLEVHCSGECPGLDMEEYWGTVSLEKYLEQRNVV